MKIKLKSKKLSYELDIHEKYTIVSGDSGSGKTTFYKCVLDARARRSPIKIECDIPVLAVEKYADITALKEENVIYVIDENCSILQELAKLNSIDAYFIFIFRKQFSNKNEFRQLSISVTSILEMIKDGKGYHYTKPMYNKFNTRWIGKVDEILVEDAKSGALFFEYYFPSMQVTAAGGASNITKMLWKSESTSKLVVYDSAAFGMYFADLKKYVTGFPAIKVLDWESFESYVLELPFIDYELAEDTPCTYSSRENYAETVLAKIVPYKKGTLIRCLDHAMTCSKCMHNLCNAAYKDTKRTPSYYLQGALATIEENSSKLGNMKAF